AAAGPDQSDGGVVDVTDAIPEDVPIRRPHQQRALSDPERWRDAHPDETGLELAELDAVVHEAELFHRGPGLTPLSHVLALVLADRAVLRRRLAGRLLHRAGRADVRPHSAAAGSVRAFSLSPGSFRLYSRSGVKYVTATATSADAPATAKAVDELAMATTNERNGAEKLFETSTRVRNAPFARPRMCAGTSRWRGTNA